MFVKRLEILADHLDNVHARTLAGTNKRDFSLMCWLGRSNTDCGTSACAIGEASFIPAFRKLGLRISKDGSPRKPLYKKLQGWAAVEKFFGLDEAQAERLFGFSGYVEYNNAKEVADSIRATVAKYRSS